MKINENESYKLKKQNVQSKVFRMLICDPMNGKTEIYRLSCSVRIFKCFEWDTFKVVFYMKNETLLARVI